MGFWSQVGTWFTQATHWSGSTGIPVLFCRQIELSMAVLAAALLIGGGIGLVCGHFNRASLVAVNAANAARAVPTLALLTLLAIIPAIAFAWDGFLASFLALTVLAIPPILTNSYVGVREVDRDVKEAATAMGLSHLQVMFGVELPMAVGPIATGVLVAAVEVVATSTLADYVGYGDLGYYVFAGLATEKDVEAFSGAVLVGVTAAIVAVVFSVLRRLLTPAPLRAHGTSVLSAAAGTGLGRLSRRWGKLTKTTELVMLRDGDDVSFDRGRPG